MLRIAFLLAVLSLAVPFGQAAQDDAAKAQALLEAQKYVEAKSIFAKLVEKDGSVANWMRLAFCTLQSGDSKGAIAAYESAIAKGGPEGLARYNIACAYARMGEKTRALDALEKATGKGFGRAHMLKADEDFNPLRDEPRFKALLDKLSEPTKGLKGADAMDLWIGEWTVYANKQVAGQNSIRKTLDGFAVEEFWTSRSGGKGQSLFTFDPAKGQWRQLWIDDRGWTIEKVGVPIENGIRYEGWSYNADGTKQRARTTLTKYADGSVRQLIEMEEKDGSWSVGFDGKYVRKK